MADEDGFASKLGDPRQRFLACVVEHGLVQGMRTPDDFLRHFSPRAIMAAMEDAEMRAALLEQTIGIKRKVGIKKSAASAGEDIQIALDEGVTNSETIVALFLPDQRAQLLDAAELWGYVVEPEFWEATPGAASAWRAAREHLAYILTRALAEKLLTPRDIVEGLGVAILVQHLPAPIMEGLLAAALRQGRIQEPFTEDELIEIATPEVLTEHVPLAEIWQRVVVPRLADRQGLVEGRSSQPSPARSAPAPQRPAPLASPPPAVSRPPPTRAMPGPPPAIRAVPRPPAPAPEPNVSASKRSSRAPRRSVPPR